MAILITVQAKDIDSGINTQKNMYMKMTLTSRRRDPKQRELGNWSKKKTEYVSATISTYSSSFQYCSVFSSSSSAGRSFLS